VFARGVRRLPIFGDDEDRLYFLNLFGVVTDRVGWPVLGYCLMTNHFHLLFETPEPNLSEGMHRQLGAYAQWFNGRYRVEGHVFERRFGSILARDDAHLLQMARYVVLNPVRAKICSHPVDYRWSSYRATIGLGRPPRFLSRERLLDFFRGPGEQEENYERFVLEGLAGS